jgi:hypothetical protein
MAIAVGFWAMGIGNSFTKFEKIEILSIYAEQSSPTRFTIYLQLKNTGTAAATINNIFLDGKPWSAVSGVSQNLVNVVFPVGYRYNTGQVVIPVSQTWGSGNYVELEIETTAGRLYSTTVVLP